MIQNEKLLNNHTEDFILKYTAAVKAKISHEQLAEYLGMKSKSLKRRRQELKKEMGRSLAELHSDPNIPFKSVSKKYFEALESLHKKIIKTEEVNAVQFKTHIDIKKNKTYIITSAQNATPINDKFFKSLQQYTQYNDAELLIIPYRYKNPTSVWTLDQKDSDWWAPELAPFLIEREIKLGEHIRVMGKTKIHPTASSPLSGFDSASELDSAIYGHPKIEWKTVPSVPGKIPKILTTTGSITTQNYTDSKAGHKGAMHHTFGALVLEIDSKGMYNIRHVTANMNTGEFYDLDKLYTPKDVFEDQSILALYAGDSHSEVIDSEVKAALYTNHDSVANLLKPSYMVFGDVLDFNVRSHHTIRDPLGRYKKHHTNEHNNVERELQKVADFLDEVTKPFAQNIIVKSNHDEHIERWLKEANPNEDPENAKFFHYLKYNQYKAISDRDYDFDVLEFWMKNPDEQRGMENDSTVFLCRNESFEIAGVECSLHGDVGPNGARGSLKGLARMGQKLICGHSHSPGIIDQSYQVGTSTALRLDYNKGPSSWLNTSAIIYPDGAVTLINIINGKWKKGA